MAPIFPSVAGRVTIMASPVASDFSGDTSSNCIFSLIVYAASLAIFCAFSTASSMLPTI